VARDTSQSTVTNSSSIPRRSLVLLVAGLLISHYALAASSLLLENPTVDEVCHLPAGVTYWQTGSFRLYHHNPPLIKMAAALPILSEANEFRGIVNAPIWKQQSIPQAPFGHAFAQMLAPRYFEVFTKARLVMPLFSILGGLVVFFWSRKLFGDRAALLSLTLWCLCPNILAHGRLITSDVGASALGAAATFTFWRYLHRPTWGRAAITGLVLGLAQLSKFSMLLLYLLWPVLWLLFELSRPGRRISPRELGRSAAHGFLIVFLSILTINLGYGFEGTGRRLGSFGFASRSFLTKPGFTPGKNENPLINLAWKHRVNRFRGTWLAGLPAPFPEHYLVGFDEQKIEADGIPLIWMDPTATNPDAVTGYTVYLDGVLRRTGWRSYYVLAFLYKTPEGTIALLAVATLLFFATKKARANWGDEAVLLMFPVTFFAAMTFLTDINIGLRYVLPIFPYLFVFIGRLGQWADGLSARNWRAAWAAILVALGLTAVSTLSVHPHYLAHFNRLSGGPDRDPPRLIDSNLDWGQDLIGLREWLRNHPEEGPIGLAYFGHIPPNIFELRREGFPWFLPAARPKRLIAMTSNLAQLKGAADHVRPGLYAVSATLREGLSWRVYDPSTKVWAASWNAQDFAYDYFRIAKPFDRIGHSILLFRLSETEAARLEAERLRPVKE
jgi:hypothetical protein